MIIFTWSAGLNTVFEQQAVVAFGRYSRHMTYQSAKTLVRRCRFHLSAANFPTRMTRSHYDAPVFFHSPDCKYVIYRTSNSNIFEIYFDNF